MLLWLLMIFALIEEGESTETLDLKWKDKSKIAMGYGTAFHHQGVGLLNLGNFDLMINVSLDALNWKEVPTISLPEFREQCQGFDGNKEADVKLVCGYLMPMYQVYQKRNEIFKRFVNADLSEEIPLLIPGISLREVPQRTVNDLPESWFQSMDETLNRHMANLTREGHWSRAGNRFVNRLVRIDGETSAQNKTLEIQRAADNWMKDLLSDSSPNQNPGTPETPVLWQEEPETEPDEVRNWSWVSRRGNLMTEWEKHVRSNPQLTNYTMPSWAKRILNIELGRYRTYWKRVYRMKLNEIRAVRISIFQEVRNNPEVYQNLWQRFRDDCDAIDAVVGDRVTDQGIIDYIGMQNAHEAELVKNTIRITLLPTIRLWWNSWTKMSVIKFRELASRVESREPEVSAGFEEFKQWLDREYIFWRSAPTGVGIASRIRTLSEPTRGRQRRQALALGLGVASLVGSAVSATTSMMSVHRLSEKFEEMERGQQRDHREIVYLSGAMAALTGKTLKVCEKLQEEMKETRQELRKIGQAMQRLAESQVNQEEELVRLHIAVLYGTDATARLVSLMMKEMALQGYYLAQLQNLKESVQKLQRGVLPEFLVSPSELQTMLGRVQTLLTSESRSFVPVFEKAENYYKMNTVAYAMRNGSLIVNVKIPLRRFNDPVFDLFTTTVVDVPVENSEGNDKFTKMSVADKVIGMAHSSFVEITKGQLDRCTKVNMLFLCAGTVLAHASTQSECLSAVYNNKHADKVKDLCEFTISTGRPRPQLIETGSEVLMANVPSKWSFLCDDQNRVPTGIEPGRYVLFRKSFLCHCSIQAGEFLATQNIEACWKKGEANLSLSFSTNMAASMYLFSRQHQVEYDQRMMKPEQIKLDPIKIIQAPEVDAMRVNNDEWVLGDLKQFAQKTRHDHQVYLNNDAFALRNAGEQTSHRWALTGILVAVSVSMAVLGIWICCWGRNLKSRFKDLQIVSLLRSNWQRRSGRLREQRQDNERVVRFLKKEQEKRMRRRETLKSHVNEAVQNLAIGPEEPQDVEMSEV